MSKSAYFDTSNRLIVRNELRLTDPRLAIQTFSTNPIFQIYQFGTYELEFEVILNHNITNFISEQKQLLMTTKPFVSNTISINVIPISLIQTGATSEYTRMFYCRH